MEKTRGLLLSFLLTFTMWSCMADNVPNAFMNSRGDLTIDGELYSSNFFSGRYGNGKLFKSNTKAQENYESYEILKFWSNCLLSATVVGVSTLVITSKEEERFEKARVGVLGILPSIFLRRRASTYLTKAVNIYNGVSPSVATVVPVVSISKRVAGLGVSISF